MTTGGPRLRARHKTGLIALFASMSVFGSMTIGLTTAGPASAGLLPPLIPSCAPVPMSTTFAAWGDPHLYFSMPGGDFENAAQGWTLSGGSAVVEGNETFAVNDTSDSQSLAMPTGARAVSPTVCVCMGENTIRLFVKNSGVASSVLHVQAYVQNPLTGLVLSTRYDIKGTDGPTGWKATSPLLIPNLLGAVLGTQNLTLVFTTSGAPASWNIDDIYVDPFKQR